MAANLTILSECMGRFKNNDPKVYETFIRTMDQYVTDLLVNLSAAPSSDILGSQGRAQQAQKFFQLFTEIPQ
jgi:hypothetical protein